VKGTKFIVQKTEREREREREKQRKKRVKKLSYQSYFAIENVVVGLIKLSKFHISALDVSVRL
jgi:hypothetical protein